MGTDECAQQLLQEEGQCQALEKIHEVAVWFEGVARFNAAGGQDVYNNILRGFRGEQREWHAKLAKLAEEHMRPAK